MPSGDTAPAPTRIHFPGLNALRFLAALGVLVHHVEQFKSLPTPRLPGIYGVDLVRNLGAAGVSLFFVLSGFLITYLLLDEERTTGHIDVRRFYVRRVLRIWPLYYFVTALAFFVLPSLHDPTLFRGMFSVAPWTHQLVPLGLFVFFLPNAALVGFPAIVGASQAWSVGVEEQFYALWPLLVRRYRRSLPLVLVVVGAGRMAAVWLLDTAARRASVGGGDLGGALRLAALFLGTFQIEKMCVGGLFAWLVFTRRGSVPPVLRYPVTRFVALVAVLLLACLPGTILPFQSVFEAACYAILIVGTALDPRTRLERPFWDYLGSISYGLYMYHPTVIVLAIGVFRDRSYWQAHGLLLNVALYGLAVAGTVGVSAVSYRWLELPFLRLKRRFGERSLSSRIPAQT